MLKDFYSLSLPKLNPSTQTSGLSLNPKHDEARLMVDGSWNHYEGIESRFPIRAQPFEREFHLQDGLLSPGNEPDLTRRIASIIEAPLKRGPFKIHCSVDQFLVSGTSSHNTYNFFLFFSGEGFPVGAVEIKVPGRSGVNNEIFAGQLYDYLRILRDIFGIDCPYGILSTYDEWRFCWLSRISKGRRNTAAEPRNLIFSRVFKQDDKDLPKALVWTLNAMAESTAVNDTGVPTQGEYHLFMNSEEVQWKEFNGSYRQDSFPAEKKRGFFIFAFVGSGAQGTVWKGCDEEGNACAVKVFDKKTNDEASMSGAVDKELMVWHEVFQDTRIFRVTLTTVPALIMPILDQGGGQSCGEIVFCKLLCRGPEAGTRWILRSDW